jgi:hypothetical protein
MKYFLNEIRTIPRLVWPIAALITGGMSWWFLRMSRGIRMGSIEIAGAIWGALFLFAYILLVGYIYADARRRGMRYIMWTLLTIFIPYGIGAILYFVLREPLLVSCPKCGAGNRSIFVFCPKCGSELSPSCPACKRAVEPGWNLCAYCGEQLAQPVVECLEESR